MCGEHRQEVFQVGEERGIIPACAGSTTGGTTRDSARWDHPRMCGEHLVVNAKKATDKGSSPHVRGARLGLLLRVHWGGIIPACAGSTQDDGRPAEAGRDHPRMCGEHVGQGEGQGPPEGIIPACAGSTKSRSRSSPCRRDHPRMCGEHRAAYSSTDLPMGSSPHVRGARHLSEFLNAYGGIIPACAGSTIATCSTAMLSMGSSPHVRGARYFCAYVPDSWGIIPACAGSTEFDRLYSYNTLGIIPACAGSTLRRAQRPWYPWDHPRMCGEHWSFLSIRKKVPWDHPRMCGEHHNNHFARCKNRGSSPHVRGAR